MSNYLLGETPKLEVNQFLSKQFKKLKYFFWSVVLAYLHILKSLFDSSQSKTKPLLKLLLKLYKQNQKKNPLLYYSKPH